MANLAAAYTAWGKPDRAVPLLQQALAREPEQAELHYNLGNAHLAQDDLTNAAAAYETALGLDPAHEGAGLNLGVAFKELGELELATVRLRRTVEIAPDNADAHWNLALALLAQGRFEEGWAEYEWRRRIPGFATRDFDAPAWDGSPLEGRTLLIHAEQGLGDTIQFARYLSGLSSLGGRILFLCPDRLAPLIASAFVGPEIEVVAAPPRRFDLHAPLMSLPHLLGRPDPTAAEGPYLSAMPERVARWRPMLDAGFRVGLCWQGNRIYRADARRSIPLRHFAPLAALNGVNLVSLQVGDGQEQIAEQPWGPQLITFPEEFDRDGAFLDSAAAIAALDLVVTSDTAVAHLSGAMGAETWLLLPHVPDWRWGTAGETTPWYPTMRLYRQDRPGDWDGVFRRVAAALNERLTCA
jgi:tetratricopeptide (TPR) repeat protein